MSYQDIARSGRELRPTSADSGQDKATKDLIAAIFKLQTGVSRLKGDVSKLGTPRDTVELRQKVAAAMQRMQTSAQEIKEQLMHVHGDHKTPQSSKILADFETTLKDFQNTMKVARGKEAATLPRRPQPPSSAATSTSAGLTTSSGLPLDVESVRDPLEKAALLQEQKRQEVLELDNYVAYNEALIDERDQGIAEIGQQINEVHEIFQDLAVLVHDQGQMVDTIDENITRTEQHTQDAGVQLRKAEKSQRAARNRNCFILMIVAFVLAILVVLFLVS